MRSSSLRLYSAIVAAALALAFATPLRVLWLREAAPWWSVFVLWAAAVLALFLLARASHAVERQDPTPDKEHEP